MLAVHATRTVADVPTDVARDLVARSARDADLSVRWASLDQPGGGRAEVRTAAAGKAAEDLLDDVRDDDGLVAIVPATAVDATVRVLTVGGRHPLRDPARYPLETPAAERPGEVTTLSIVGDVMLGRRVAQASGDDPIRTLRPTAKRLAAAEITVGNLESTLSDDGSPTQGGDSFHADPEVIDGLELAGFDLVSLANNHLGDYGQRALRQTLAELRDADLPYVGAGRDLDEARKPVVITRDGVRVGFLGTESIGETPAATADRGGTNRLNMPPRTGPLNERQLDRITGDIADLSKAGRRGGGDPALGHPVHPRARGQPAPRGPRLRRRRGRPGDRRASRTGCRAGRPAVTPWSCTRWATSSSTWTSRPRRWRAIFVEIVLWGDQVKAVEPVPYELDSRFVPRVVKGDRAADILDDVWSTSRGPFARP